MRNKEIRFGPSAGHPPASLPRPSQVKFMASVQAQPVVRAPVPVSLSAAVPVTRSLHDAALRAGREPIGMWPLMLWAYGKEMVRYTCGGAFEQRHSEIEKYATPSWIAKAGLSPLSAEQRLAHMEACCHEDALLVHAAVLGVISAARGPGLSELDDCPAHREAFELLIRHAEEGYPPTWQIPVPVWKARPVWRKKPSANKPGKPTVVNLDDLGIGYNQPNACLIECVGVIGEIGLVVRSLDDWRFVVDQARTRYETFIALLNQVVHRMLPEHSRLKRWRLSGLGVAAEPWACD